MLHHLYEVEIANILSDAALPTMSVLSAAETKRLREKVRTAKKHFELGAAISLAFKSMSPSQRYRLHSLDQRSLIA